MSYSKNQRIKTIRKFKKAFGEEWESYFRKFTEECIKEKCSPPIGTLQEIMDIQGQV